MTHDEQQNPEIEASLEDVKPIVVEKPGEDENFPAIKTERDEVHVQVESARQIEPSDQIPDFDPRELHHSMVRFIELLKTMVPEERRSEVDPMGKYLKEVVIEIAMEAHELKTLNVILTPEQRELSRSATANIPQELHQTVIKEWGIHLRLITGLLNQFNAEGMKMFVGEGWDRFTMNVETLNKLLELMKAMMETDKLVRKWNVLTKEEAKHYEELYGSIKETIPDFSGINWEDILDAKVDELLYQEILEGLSVSAAPEMLSRKYILAILVNCRHLRNSLAAQKIATLDILMGDIADGVADNPDYYDATKDIGLFSGEAHTVAYMLAVLERSISGIIASQKIAQLMGKSANPLSQEPQEQPSPSSPIQA